MTATKTNEPLTPAAPGSEPWMPNGFPPPSFVVETERTSTFAGARGRWLAAAAILGALLLIAGILLIARDGDNTDVATGSTTTSFGGTNPTFTSTSGLDPATGNTEATLPPGGAAPVDPNAPPASVDPSATTTPPPPGATPPPPPPGTPVGILAASPTTVPIPKVDSTVGVQTGKVTLRNTGAGGLRYSTRSTSGLTVDRPTGDIAAGGATELTITLNGAGLGEGPYNGTLLFEGSGGTQNVKVTSVVGRPPVINDANPACAVEGGTCSKQIIAIPPSGNPCTSQWQYAVNVSDESTLSSVKADTVTDVPLKINGGTNGPGGAWRSDPQQPLGPNGTITFTIEAVDIHGYVRRSTERKIVCPPA